MERGVRLAAEYILGRGSNIHKRTEAWTHEEWVCVVVQEVWLG